MEEPGLHLGEALDPKAFSPHWQPLWNTNVRMVTRCCPKSYGSPVQPPLKSKGTALLVFSGGRWQTVHSDASVSNKQNGKQKQSPLKQITAVLAGIESENNADATETEKALLSSTAALDFMFILLSQEKNDANHAFAWCVILLIRCENFIIDF